MYVAIKLNCVNIAGGQEKGVYSTDEGTILGKINDCWSTVVANLQCHYVNLIIVKSFKISHSSQCGEYKSRYKLGYAHHTYFSSYWCDSTHSLQYHNYLVGDYKEVLY